MVWSRVPSSYFFPFSCFWCSDIQSYQHRLSKRIFSEHWIFLVAIVHGVDSLWLHGLQHARLPCLSPSPRACSNSCPLSWWCHPTILSPVVPFSSHLQFFPASGSFLMSWLLASGDQSLELQHQSFQWAFRTDFLYDWLVWSPCSPGDSEESSPTPQLKSMSSLAFSFLYWAISHIHTWLLEKP